MRRKLVTRLIVGCLAIIISPISAVPEQMVALVDNHPSVNLGNSPAPPDTLLHMQVWLKIRNKEEFDRAIKEAEQGRNRVPWTPQGEHQQFGSLPADFHMVERWLLLEGFTIFLERYGLGPVDSIMFTGTIAEAEKAFGVKIVESGHAYANTSDPVVPLQIAAVVDRIYGLDNLGVIRGGPAGGPPKVAPQSFIIPNRGRILYYTTIRD